MAVRFILGPAGSGKTHYCLTTLRALERAGKPAIYLVPEQSTYTADRELLEGDDLPGLRQVRVLSFRRLAFWLRDLTGVPVPTSLSEAARPMFLRAVLSRLPEASLGPLAPLRSRQGFLEELARFVGEVRNHGASDFVHTIQQDLAGAASIHPGIRRKLHALAAAFNAYDTALRDRGWSDPEEMLAGIPPLIAAERERLRETRFLVDGFLSWTRREREILVALGHQGVPLEITINCDPIDCGADVPGIDVRAPFLPVRRSLESLTASFERARAPIDPPLDVASLRSSGSPVLVSRSPSSVHANTRFRSVDLERLERDLYRKNDPAEAAPTPARDAAAAETAASGAGTVAAIAANAAPRVTLQATSDPRQQVLLWARTIDRWIRSGDEQTRPGEIAVILRSLEPYRDLIRRIFPLYRIPFFLDERRSLLAHPRARLLLGACEVLLSKWRRDPVIALLRNPLMGAAPASIDLLENLSLEYGHDFEDWYGPPWREYSMPPRARWSRRRLEEICDAEDFDITDSGGNPLFDPCLADEERLENDPSEADLNAHAGIAADFGGAPMRSAVRPVLGPVALVDPLRRRLLQPLRRMQEAWEQQQRADSDGLTGPEAVSLLRRFEDEIAAAAPRREHELSSDPLWDEQVHDALDRLLEELEGLWGDVPVSLDEFARTFRQGLGGVRIGVTPLRLDQVVISEIQRSRLSGIRRAVVGGLNDGEFPHAVGDDTILNEQDRAALASLDISLGPNAWQRQEEETYLFYVAVTRASDELLLTWDRLDADGRGRSPSLFLNEIERALPGVKPAGPPADPESSTPDQIQTPDELGARIVAEIARWVDPITSEPLDPLLAGLYNLAHAADRDKAPIDRTAPQAGEAPKPSRPSKGPGPQLTLSFEAPRPGVADSPAFDAPLVFDAPLAIVRAQIDRSRPSLLYQAQTFIEDSLLGQIFPPGDLVSSVSRLREFADCPYLSFARHRLRLTPRPRAEVSPLETGNLAHAALERFFRNPNDPAPIEQRLAAIFRELEERPEFQAFKVDEASRYRLRSTVHSLTRFLRLETHRLKGSDYRIKERELAFGPHLGTAVEIPLPDRDNLLLLGRIDRLDVRTGTERPYGLVLDYKSRPQGSVPLRLERGLDLQLAAYLLFVQDVLGWVPAGGLYVPVLPSPIQAEKLEPNKTNTLGLKVQGIFLRDEREAIDGDVGMLAVPRANTRQALTAPADMQGTLDRARGWLRSYASTLRSGWIEAVPLEAERGRLACDHCDFAAVCRFRLGRDPLRRDPGEGMNDPPPPVEASTEPRA